MKVPKRKLYSLAKRAPVVGDYVARKNRLHAQVVEQANIIQNLTATVEALKARNEAWEAEVRAMRGDAKSLKVLWPVFEQDLLTATINDKQAEVNRPSVPPYTFNWVVPPMGPVSGGHADIFRFVKHLETTGNTCRIYFYDPLEQYSMETIVTNLKNYPKLDAEIFYNDQDMAACDAIFATSWHTAYPVVNYRGNGKKFYFIQDFEPFFDPVGSYSTLASNTYKFGLHGLTLGSWLAEKITKEYGMTCDALDFGVDLQEYSLLNPKPRKEVLFYARPVTPRRGFELGVLALQDFHTKHPDYIINFVGWDITPYQIPFPYVNQGILPVEGLRELYNRCAAGLVLSFTNMSLLPLEMLASGCQPVVNDEYHTRMVDFNDLLQYTDTTPSAISDNLYASCQRLQSKQEIKRIATKASEFQWTAMYDKIDKILLRELS